MSTEHRCPRRDEHGPDFFPGADTWREDFGHRDCSFCGSLHPDDFMQHVENGCVVDPSDKNYKAYIHIPNSRVGNLRIVGSATHKPQGDGWQPVTDDLRVKLIAEGVRPVDIPDNGRHVMVGQESPMDMTKFYYMHLTTEQKKRFVALLNEGKIKIGYPHNFYVMPYFIAKDKPCETPSA